MTDDLVGRLRALCEAANPGTWMQVVADNPSLLGQIYMDAAKVEDRVAGLIYTRGGGAHGKGVTLATINARRSTIERDQANALLIVEAVNALPTLLARIEALEAALNLALGFLIKDEPGDSRLVSDEFVAMAVILEGDDDVGCLPIIQAAIAARKAKDSPHAN